MATAFYKPRILLLAATLGLATIVQSTEARATVARKAPVSRLTHAKELLGNHYKHSVVRAGERWADLSRQIREWTHAGMKSSSKRIREAVAKAILSESKRYELDPVFLTAVIQSESSFRPSARGSAGEIGMMQLLPDTAKWIAAKYRLPWKGKKTLLDPVMNIRIGAAYFDFLRERFENHGRLYLSAYNMGPENVERALEKNIWPKDYARRVMRHYIALYTELGAAATAAATRAAVTKARALASRVSEIANAGAVANAAKDPVAGADPANSAH